MDYKPIIVCGPGSCGTSTVAAWFATNGVNMGQGARAPYWEDQGIKGADQALWDGGRLSDWQYFMKRIERARCKQPWGFKDPRVCEVFDAVTQTFPRAVYFRIHRDRADVIKSLRRLYGPPERWRGGDPQLQTWAEELRDRREAMLDAYWPTLAHKFDVPFSDVADGSFAIAGKEAIESAGRKLCLST